MLFTFTLHVYITSSRRHPSLTLLGPFCLIFLLLFHHKDKSKSKPKPFLTFPLLTLHPSHSRTEFYYSHSDLRSVQAHGPQLKTLHFTYIQIFHLPPYIIQLGSTDYSYYLILI